VPPTAIPVNPSTGRCDQVPSSKQKRVGGRSVGSHRRDNTSMLGDGRAPVKMRETAFAGAERCLRAAGCELGVAGQQLDRIVDLQMKAIRQVVTDIAVSGTSQGRRL
jgi:hypothetical protein